MHINVAVLAQDLAATILPARLPPVLPLCSQSRSSTGRKCCCAAMAVQKQPTFQALLTECIVPMFFPDWLAANTMFDRAKFLLGAPKDVDAELICQYPDRLSLAQTIKICMAYTMCQQPANDEKEARTAAKLSPDSANIPIGDRETLNTLFERRHGFMVSSKRLLNDELVKKIFHGFHANPKRPNFYLPEQLRLSTSSAPAIGTSLNFIGGSVLSTDIVAHEDFR